MTTEVSFYHLTRSPLEKALPKLLEKVYGSKKHALLITTSDKRVKELDTVLWTYTTNFFLPHGTGADDFTEQQPIFITHREDNPNHSSVLVAVDGVEPSFVEAFEKCLDIFDGADENAVAAARARWKKYEARGFSLTYWKQEENGSWKKAA